MRQGAGARRSVSLALAAVATIAASPANAGAYAGASLVDTHLSHTWPYSAGKERVASGLGITGGYRVGPSFAVEGRFTDYGKVSTNLLVACLAIVGVACPSGASVSTDALSVSAVGILPIGRVELFARGGFAHWRTTETVSGSLQPGSFVFAAHASGSDAVLGVGVDLPMRRLALRIEYERFAPADERMGTIAVGFVYGFMKREN